MPLSSDFTKYCKSPEEEADLEKTFKNSVYVLSFLLKMMQDREAQASKIELSLKTYDSPSWAYVQAHINGMKAENQYIQRWLKEITGTKES